MLYSVLWQAAVLHEASSRCALLGSAAIAAGVLLLCGSFRAGAQRGRLKRDATGLAQPGSRAADLEQPLLPGNGAPTVADPAESAEALAALPA